MTEKYAPSRIDKTLGRRLKEERLRAGRSQTDVGKAVGVSFQQIQKYEKGVNRISFSMLVRLCRELGLDMNAFIDSVLDESGEGDSGETCRSAAKEPIGAFPAAPPACAPAG
jgi:transcriptional regulator with XRE-family HTH domain